MADDQVEKDRPARPMSPHWYVKFGPQQPFDFEKDVRALVQRGALFVINHSAGKDSQAMFLKMVKIVPKEQMLVIHAHLGGVEWDGVIEHIEATVHGLEPLVCKNPKKTFIEMVEARGMFPSPTTRQCTSDLKRGPIEREIRRYLARHPEFKGMVVNCIGLRAQESPNRAKQKPFRLNENNSIAGREWYDMLPIHDMLIDEVWKNIADAGQKPHPAYALGMSRLSCKLCIMSTDADLSVAAKADPRNFALYVGLERKTGRTMMMPRRRKDANGVAYGPPVPMGLEEIVGFKADFDRFPEFYQPEVDFAGNREKTDASRNAVEEVLEGDAALEMAMM